MADKYIKATFYVSPAPAHASLGNGDGNRAGEVVFEEVGSMVVYEIKKPIPLPVKQPTPVRKDLSRVEKVMATTPVDKLLKRWRRTKERQSENRRKAPLTQEARNDVCALIAKTNADFQRQSIPIRLVLTQEDDGYVIDVYDCHDDNACRIVSDLVIDLEDLPVLLRNLDRESGILVNTIS